MVGDRAGCSRAILDPCELHGLGVEAGSLTASEAMPGRSRRLTGSALPTRLWDELLAQPRAADAQTALTAHGILLRICTEPVRDAEASPAPEAVSPGIAVAQTSARTHLADGSAVAILPQAAGLWASQFHARFSREVGQPPAAWVRQQRCEQAERLRDCSAPITTLARVLAYPSSQSFVTVFRRYIGATPGAYRRRRRTAAP